MSATPTSQVCPECGAADWGVRPDVFTWTPAQKLSLLLACLPMLWFAYLHVMLIVARLELGRWPSRWGADDPYGIPLVRELGALGAILMLAVWVAPVVNMGLLILCFADAWKRRPRLRNTAIAAVASISLWIGAYVLIRWDPTEVVVWFLD